MLKRTDCKFEGCAERTVYISKRLQGKQIGRRIGVLQFVRGRSVDGDRSAGRLIGKVPS